MTSDASPAMPSALSCPSWEDGDTIDDGELMARLAAGEAWALDTLVARHQRRLVGFLRGMLGDSDDALDAAQEVFVRVFTRARRYDPRGVFRAWLYRIATNVAIDAIRRRRRRAWAQRAAAALRPAVSRRSGGAPRNGGDRFGVRDELDELPDDADAGALTSLVDAERDGAVRRAIGTLPAPYRAAVVLRDLEELSYEEAAEALGCRIGTVKSRVNRARNLLRDKLAAHAGTAGAER